MYYSQHSIIYILRAQLTLTDLWAADSALASGLQALLSFEEGTGSIEEVFGVTFTASANPLLGFVQSAAGSGGGSLSRQVSLSSESQLGDGETLSTESHTVKVILACVGSIKLTCTISK